MKVKALTLAVTAAATMLAAPAMANHDFFGYAKVGFFTSPDTGVDGESGLNNGQARFFSADGAPGGYRLGNEGNWGEIGWRAEAYNDEETGVKADITSMIGFSGNWGEFGVQQLYGSIHNVYGGEGSNMWAGTRFYRRHADDLPDLFYWQNSGTGVGLENINLGGSRMSLAWMFGEFEGSAVNLPDIRWHDIDVLGGNLTLGVNLAFFTNDEAIKQKAAEAGYTDPKTTGYMLTATHAHTFGSVNNKIVLQYTADAAVGGFMSGNEFNNGVIDYVNTGTGFRFFDHGGVTFTDNFSMAYSLGYETLDYDNNNGKDWLNVGIRPAYAWNNWTSTLLEIGYQQAESQAGLGTNTSTKATLAQTFQVGKETWARPVVRIFATVGEEDNKWTEQNGQIVASADKFDGVNVGAQFEAWW